MNTKALVLKTKKRIFGELLGRNLSKFKGNGLDFKEFREYNYGEDAKKIDWKVSAKINKPLVKEYDEERELKIIIAIIKSGSMYFGTKKLKTELAAEILAALGIAALEEDNRIQAVFLGKEKKIFKPTKNKKSIYSFIDYALNTGYLREEYSQKDIDFLNSFKKSILFLIGDFLKPVEIGRLKHETYTVVVRDRFEEHPMFEGYTEIVDPVSFNSVNVYFNRHLVKKFQKHISEIDATVENECKKNKIPYTKIYTDEDPIFKLVKLVR